MDVLTDVLRVLQLRTNTYFCTEFQGPLGMLIPKGEAGGFHAVIAGECWITLDNNTEICLSAGDIVAFPTGASHAIGSSKIDGNKEFHYLHGQDVVNQVNAGDNPFSTGEKNITLLCGSFEYDSTIQHPFLKELPCFIHIRQEENSEKWLHPFIEALASEIRDKKPGSAVVVNSLTEILFVQLMRVYIHQSKNNQLPYMSALIHPQIGTALSYIHQDINAVLTVEKLADIMAMSRTTFTDKFTKVVGIPPKRYIIELRMQKTRSQLRLGQATMITIVEDAGYHSEAAFSKAYKNFFGEAPGKTKLKNDK